MKPSNPLIQCLREMLGGQSAVLVDVGASLGVHPRWKPFAEVVRVVGYEPNEEEFRKLPQTEQTAWINAAIGGKDEKRTLHLTKRFNNSSLLRPNARVIEQLEWGDDFEIIRDVILNCITLDNSLTAQRVRPDFLKLDTQGTEWEILQGAPLCLSQHAVFVEVEVEFCELYTGQRLFADVDCELRRHGFYLHDVANHLFVKPRGLGSLGGPKGRLISADCLYFKEPENVMTSSDAKIGASIIAYLAYGYPDAALHLLNVVEANGRSVPHSPNLRKFLRSFRHSSRWLDWLPARNILTRLAKRFNLDFRRVEHSLWENELGNRLIAPK